MITILVVDDEVDVEHLLRRCFRSQIQLGLYEFRFVFNGVDALIRLRTEADIDLVLLDVNMPELDGLSLLEQLPALNPILQVIMVSASGDMANVRQAMNRGAFDFICKPIDLMDLDRTLSKTAQHIQQLRRTPHSPYHRNLRQYPHPPVNYTKPDTDVPIDPFLEQVYGLLDQHLDAPLSVKWVADTLAISRKTLYRKVQKLTQVAPNELIRTYRLRRAAHLLLSGQAVSQVAYQVGFETPSHFAQAFRELYGQTPSEFAHR